MNHTCTRRAFLYDGLLASAVGACPVLSMAESKAASPTTAEEWLEEVQSSKALAAPLRMSRFVEPVYYLLDPGVIWTPNPDNGPSYTAVHVPQGFVTDLASIPPTLFPLLRADGEYAQAAIVHDYLYWTQRTTREYADDVFRIAMRDLEVASFQVKTIHAAVRAFGQAAWDRNAGWKRAGERRFLKTFPTQAATRWSNWKLDFSRFHPGDL